MSESQTEKVSPSTWQERVRVPCPDCGFVFVFGTPEEAQERMTTRGEWHGEVFCAKARLALSVAARRRLDIDNYGSEEAAALMRGEISVAHAEAMVAERAPVKTALAKAKAKEKDTTGAPPDVVPRAKKRRAV